MKTLRLLAIATVMLCIVSCNSQGKKGDANETTIESLDSTASNGIDTTETSMDNEEENATSSAKRSDSEDWDALLDAYESYVTKYLSYAKKAAKGDASALSEYPALMEKAEELGHRLENAKDDMSAKQLKRYMAITSKMATAAQELH